MTQKKLPSKPWDFQLTPPGGPHVISYASIFDSLWRQAGLYQQSKDKLHVAEDELANMKQYLNEVLKEVGSMKNKTL